MRNIAKEVYNSDLRDNQRHFLNFYDKNHDKNIIAEMPTGSGKSLIAMHIGLNHPDIGTVFIVTPTKDLMKQYERDFGHLDDVMLLAGKNEYNCIEGKEFNLSAESCTHDENKPCDFHYSMDRASSDCCEYSKRINLFSEYKVVVTNYHMMMALIQIKQSKPWHSPLIIWDEGHKFQDIIRDMAGIEYNSARMARITDDDLSDSIYKYIQNDEGNLQNILNELDYYQKLYNTKETISRKRYLERIDKKLRIISQYEYLKPEPYEKEDDNGNRESCIRVIPVDYTQLTKATYAKAAFNHLMMSGTIHYPQMKTDNRLDILEKITGMPMDVIYQTPVEYHFKQENIEKIAPVNLNNIYYNNSNNYNDFKNVYGPLIDLIKEKNVNTMIHFNAMWQCKHMKRALRDLGYKKPVYDFHNGENNTKSKQKIKEDFIRTGGVIVGSSLHEGLDFPGDQLEMVVIGRSKFVPYDELDKFYPGEKDKIPNKIRKIWEGLKLRGVPNIEQEEYRLTTLQQIGRLQRKSDDEGIVVICNHKFIHRSISKDFDKVKI